MRRSLVAAVLALLLLPACGGDDGGGERESAEAETTTTTEAGADDSPRIGDHIHLAYGISVCGEWLEPLVDRHPDETGIHTHRDGLIHVHPFSPEATGDRAVLDVWAAMVDLGLGDGELELPDGSRHADGDDCDGQPATLRAQVWDSPADTEPEVITDDLGDLPLREDGAVIAIVFAPEGVEVDLPRWSTNLQQPTLTEQGKEPLVS